MVWQKGGQLGARGNPGLEAYVPNHKQAVCQHTEHGAKTETAHGQSLCMGRARI